MISYFPYQGTTLAFQTNGHGERALLLFHGFGQDASSFEPLCDTLQNKYLCYSFNLFFHGGSELNEQHNPLTKIFLNELLTAFFKERNIDSFSVLGFSMGSKLALACAELFPEKVKEIYLLAPDSITPNTWYTIATGNPVGRSLFKFITRHPGTWQTMLSLAGSLKIIPPRLSMFAASQMKTELQRLKVYNSWMAFRKLSFNMEELCNKIVDHHITLTVFIGKRDSIITLGRVEKIKKYIPDFTLTVLDCGHSNMIKAAAEYFKR